ncbi:unnamed protein product [Vicia faba]|uniref:Uncharacterized protein n=1 Tax=Vicia faba TaxID=3906 RepID=A0AAV0YDH9_VICFA|nr:unnamed protein product [Vicia faba]
MKEKFQVYPLSLKESSQKFLDIQKYLREKLQSSFVDTNTKSSTEKEESDEFLDLQKSSPVTVPLPATCPTFFSATNLTSFFGWKPKSDVVATICQDLALNQFGLVFLAATFSFHGKRQC